MNLLRTLGLATVLAVAVPVVAEAGYYGYNYSYQPYYTSYSYYPSYGYYYSQYYYQPSYYHYCIYQPGYTYYYNPYRGVYWGRYDHAAKGYSLLAEAHRKPTLAEIQPEWFPTPGKMPLVPGSGPNGPRMAPPPAPPQK